MKETSLLKLKYYFLKCQCNKTFFLRHCLPTENRLECLFRHFFSQVHYFRVQQEPSRVEHTLQPGFWPFTLVKLVSETVGDSDTKQYLPCPPWVTWQKIETILSLLLRRPRWPRLEQWWLSLVAGVLNFANVNMAYRQMLSKALVLAMKKHFSLFFSGA